MRAFQQRPVSAETFRFLHGDPATIRHIAHPPGGDVETVGWAASEFEVYAHLTETYGDRMRDRTGEDEYVLAARAFRARHHAAVPDTTGGNR